VLSCALNIGGGGASVPKKKDRYKYVAEIPSDKQMPFVKLKTRLFLKMAVGWVVAPCCLVKVSRRFRDGCSIHSSLSWWRQQVSPKRR
jgi:hypothetical protein